MFVDIRRLLESEEDVVAQSCSRESELPFSEKRLICAVRLPCQTTPDPSSGLFGATVCMSPLLAESVMRVLFALPCQHVRPDPFGKDMRKDFDSPL